MTVPAKELVAVWKSPDIPVALGQRLLALRTHTDNRTLYLFDHDGERPGWVSGDTLDEVGFVPSHYEVYIAVVSMVKTDILKGPLMFKVHLNNVRQNGKEAAQLRQLKGWPASLGDQPGELEYRFGELYKILTTMHPGAPDAPFSKGTSMKNALTSRASAILSDNGDAMKNAAYLEAGVITNRQLTKLAVAKAPLMVRGYIDTPVGKLVIANLFAAIAREFRPEHKALNRLACASLEAAHLEMIRTLDLDGLINELLSSETIKRALGSLGEGEQQ